MGSVEYSRLAEELDADTRTFTLGYDSPEGYQQRLDGFPFDTTRHRAGENQFEGLAVLSEHAG